MRTIRFLLQKEFLQIFRNRAMLPIIFVMPIVQLLVLANAATFEVKNTRVGLYDEDRSGTSRRLVSELAASGYFKVEREALAAEPLDEALLRGEVRMILHIPSAFERDLRLGRPAPVQIILNAEDGATAGVVQAYLTQILARFSREIRAEVVQPAEGAASRPPVIAVTPAFWYNPDLDYETYMVPGILVILVTMIGTFLSAMNVVREKEIGTIEQLNVTPIRKGHFIVGKLLPFWILALVELAFGLVVAWLVFRIPMLGSLPLVFAMAGLYLLGMLGLGLWISTVTSTQQQAMFIAWFIIVIFILMSGLFTPIESMPLWAQRLTAVNPIAHFITIMRRVLLKGAGFGAVQAPFWALVAFAAAMLTLSVRQYRKVSA